MRIFLSDRIHVMQSADPLIHSVGFADRLADPGLGDAELDLCIFPRLPQNREIGSCAGDRGHGNSG
jgi:hypothetical protein